MEIDTMRLRGRISDAAALDALEVRTVARRLGRDGNVSDGPVSARQVLPCGARLGIDLVNDGIPEAWVEFSAPKVAGGSNVVALPLGEAVEAAGAVRDEAAEFVEWVPRFEHLRLQRVDLDRDFEGVDRADVLLGALARLRAPYAPKARLHPDPDRAGAVTLSRGPAERWVSTLYGKHQEVLNRLRHAAAGDRSALEAEAASAEGRLRFEARLRTPVLGRRHLRLVSDLDEDLLADARRHCFDRVGYGLEVSGMQRAVARVLSMDWPVTKQMNLLGLLLCESQGIAPEMHRNTASKYRRLTREAGVGAADLVDLAAAEAVWLDYDAGCVRAAS